MTPAASRLVWCLGFLALAARAAPLATIEGTEVAAEEVLEAVTLRELHGPLPRSAPALAAVVESEVTWRLARRFAAAHGFLDEADAALRFELDHAPESASQRQYALHRAVERVAAAAALRGLLPVSPNASGFTLEGGSLAWSTVCIAPLRPGPLSSEARAAAGAYLDELRASPDDVPLSQRTVPFVTPRTPLPAEVRVLVEPLRVEAPPTDGGFLDQRGQWVPQFDPSTTARFVDASWGGLPCLVEVLARCPSGCARAEAVAITDRVAFERGARFGAYGVLRQRLWWSAPVSFAPALAGAARVLSRGGIKGVGLPRPEAVRLLLSARARPKAPVWTFSSDGGVDGFTGAELIRDFDESAPHHCFSELSHEACEAEALRQSLERGRASLALRAVGGARGVTDLRVDLLRAAVLTRLERAPSAADLAAVRAEFGRFPSACQQVRTVRPRADPACSIEALRGADRTALDRCDLLAVPEIEWACFASLQLGTHRSTMATCPVERELPAPVELQGLTHVVLQTVSNCDSSFRRRAIATNADLRRLQRELHNERLADAWRGVATRRAASAELERLMAAARSKVVPASANVAAAAR